MAKVTKTENWRVEVVADVPWLLGRSDGPSDEEMRRRCMEIEQQIVRHCDAVASTEICYDTKEYCSHCGYDWECDETGEPMCCTKAAEEWAAEEAKVTA